MVEAHVFFVAIYQYIILCITIDSYPLLRRDSVVTEEDAFLGDRLELSTEVHSCHEVNQEVRIKRFLNAEIRFITLGSQTDEHVAARSDDLVARRNVVKTHKGAVAGTIQLVVVELIVPIDTSVLVAITAAVEREFMAVHEHVCTGALQFFIGMIIECLDCIDSVDTSHRGCIEEVALLNSNRLGLDLSIGDGLETISEVCGT